MRKPKENRNCPYCLSPVGPDESRVRCPKCGVVHHLECWKANGSCSVYGCDGWAVWNAQISERVAPVASSEVDLTASDVAESKREAVARCIQCGRPVKPGHLLCLSCARKQDRHWFENCSGPALLILCGAVGVVTAFIRLLT